MDVAKHLFVGEANNPHACKFEQFGARPIIIGEPIVLLPVDLDGELRRMTVKIDDEAIKRDLPPKLRALQSRAAEIIPENLLGSGLTSAQVAGELTPLGAHGALCSAFRRGPQPPRSPAPSPPAPLPLGEGSATILVYSSNSFSSRSVSCLKRRPI